MASGLPLLRPAATAWRMLLGQDEQRDQFEAALAAGRMPHAWLLEGPRGIGKRGFADWAAWRLLGGGAADSPGAQLLAAGSHPDFRLLAPPEEGRGAKTATIPVDQVRDLHEFLRRHSALAPWRVVIVDAADDLNRSAANALLKLLEEPGAQTLLLLVSHAPGRLLPTIRSRCRRLRFRPLAEADMARLAPDLPEAGRARLLALARGAPGELFRLVEADALALLQALANEPPAAFARQFQPATAVPRFRLLVDLVPRLLAQQARDRHDAALAGLQQQAARLAAETIPQALDRVQVAHALAQLVRSGERPRP